VRNGLFSGFGFEFVEIYNGVVEASHSEQSRCLKKLDLDV